MPKVQNAVAVSVIRMTCTDRLGECKKVKAALEGTKGVAEVTLDYVNGTATVKYDPTKVSLDSLRKVVNGDAA